MASRRIPAALACALLVTLALGGCVPSEVSGTPTPAAVTVILGRAPSTLLPYSPVTSAQQVGSLVFQGLFDFAADGTPAPDLCTEVPSESNGGVAADGATVTLRLDPQAVWQDGKPVTASDVRFTWTLLSAGALDAGAPASLRHVQDMTVVDEHTVAVTVLDGDVAAALHAVPYVLPEHLLSESAMLLSDPFWAKPVGSGPYSVSSVRPGTGVSLQLASNADKDAPARLEILFAEGDDARRVWDSATVAVWPSATVEAVGAEQSSATPSSTWRYLLYNERAGRVTADPAVRLALSAVTTATVDASVSAGPYGTTLAATPAGLERGKQILESAGWKAGADGVRSKRGVRLHVGFYFNPEGQADGQVLDSLVNAYRALGAEVESHASLRYGSFDDPEAPLARGFFDVALVTAPFGTADGWAWPFDAADVPSRDNPDGLNVAGVNDAELQNAVSLLRHARLPQERADAAALVASRLDALAVFSVQRGQIERVLFKGVSGVGAAPEPADALAGATSWRRE